MLEIVGRVAIARHELLDADSSPEIPFQDIHLAIVRLSINIFRLTFQIHGTYLVKKEDEGRTGEKSVGADIFPEADRVFLFM